MSTLAIVGIVIGALVLIVGALFFVGAFRASSKEYTGEKKWEDMSEDEKRTWQRDAYKATR